MDKSRSAPKTCTDLSLDQLKIGFGNRISPRRLACVVDKYTLLKYLWKESQIEDLYLEKYKINNIDDIQRHDDAFSRHFLGTGNSTFTGQNEYAKERKNDNINSIPHGESCYRELSREQFKEKKFKIHELIRTEIGKKWMEFGRHLDIKAGKLDSIDDEQKEVCRKIDEIFKTFDNRGYDEVIYVEKVRYALGKSRRLDLSKNVVKIMQGIPI